jgi:septal ring factor EnvC (AmiA/AmiB activator)
MSSNITPTSDSFVKRLLSASDLLNVTVIVILSLASSWVTIKITQTEQAQRVENLEQRTKILEEQAVRRVELDARLQGLEKRLDEIREDLKEMRQDLKRSQ